MAHTVGGTPDSTLAGRKFALPTSEQTLLMTPVLSSCPDCSAALAVLRVIPGRAQAEYWALRCTRCGGIHLDIVKPATLRNDPEDLLA